MKLYLVFNVALLLFSSTAQAGIGPKKAKAAAKPSKNAPAAASTSWLSDLRGGAASALKIKQCQHAPLLMEAVGTGTLTAAVALLGKTSMSPAAKALGAASVLMSLIYSGARVSGANYNPAVTGALMMLGKMSFVQGAAYMASQVLGAVGGAFGARLLLNPGTLTDPSFELTAASGLPDGLYSFALVLTVLQTAVAKAQSRNSFFGLAISAVVAVGASLGANMNPGVAAGLFAASGTTTGLLARLAVPLLAAIPAALVFRLTDNDESMTSSKGVLPVFKSDFVRERGPYIMEGVGTFLLTSTVGLALASGGAMPAPVAAGLILTSLAFGSGYVSGGHVNPAVSLGIHLRDSAKFGLEKLAGYSAVQVVGAVAAGAVVKRALGAAGVSGNFPLPQGGFNVKQAFAAETLCTAMFVSTIMHLGSATGFQGSQLNGLVVGASLMGSLLVGGGISGGGLNPAVVSGLFLNNGASSKQIQQTLWVYLVAPLLGATLAHVGVSMTSPPELGGK